MATTSVGDRFARRGIFGGEQVDHLGNAADAVAELQHFDRDLVGREHALRRQDHPDLPRLIEFQLGVARQFRPARLADADVAACWHCCSRSSLAHAFGTKAPGGTWPST